MKSIKTLLTFTLLSVIVFISQALTPLTNEDEKPVNLKVLPKNMSEEEIHGLMKIYAKSLGVRCNHCHASRSDDPKKLDFASDAKPEKTIARKMMKMTADINKKYVSKIGKLEEVACVTCHMGRIKPVNNVDSLVAAPAPVPPTPPMQK